MNEILQKGLLRSNVPVLANALELGAGGIMNVAGNAITNTVDGQELNPAFLHSALAARIQTLITNHNPKGN
jgi:hypothetical protein